MTDSRQTEISSKHLTSFFSEFQDLLEHWRNSQEEEIRLRAPDFNVFDFIEPSENVLSDILSFLISPQASHGQSSLFLEVLIEQCRISIPSGVAGVSVARESITYAIPKARRRIDVVLTFPDFVLAIETKKFTGEGKNQIADYCEHLRRTSGGKFCLIFLTRTGEEAVSVDRAAAQELQEAGHLLLWSWEQDIPNWLAACRRECQAPKIRHFLEDFQSYIATYLATNLTEETNDEDAQ
jgi:hypothetical protein